MTFPNARPSHRTLCCLLFCCLIFLVSCQGPAATPAPGGASQPLPVETAASRPADPILSPTAAVPTASPTAAPLPVLGAPLVWYAQGSAPENAQAKAEALNRLLLERGLPVQLDIHYVESSLFERQMEELRASGTAWDLVSLHGEQYDRWLIQGLLLPLPSDGISAPALQVLDREGQIYAVPTMAVWAKPRGISIRADVVQGLALGNDLEDLHSFQDLTPLLEKIQAEIEHGSLKSAGIKDADAVKRAACGAAILFPEAAGYSALWGPLVTREDASAAVVNWYQSAEFQQLAAQRRAWQQAGYLPESPLTPDQLLSAYREGRCVVEIGHQVYPGSAAQQAVHYGYEWVDVPLSPRWVNTETILSSLIGINAEIAGDPERARRAQQMLKEAGEDEEIFHLLAGLLGWEAGVSLEEIQQWNDGAQAAPGLSFIFDPRPVAAEASAVSGAVPEWLEPLSNGQSEDIERTLKNLNNFLESAGMPNIQAALEDQYAAWLNARR